MIDFSTLPFDLALVIKIILLGVIAMYIIFVVVAFMNIKSLNRIVLIDKSLGSPFVQLLALLYLLASLSLFIAAVVIL